MGERRCEIRIGTSGWHYNHWIGPFYPEGLPKDRWLEHYAQHFDTVEINNTFYHLPREQTMRNWHDRVPAHFVFAVKASQYITHVKKLKDPQESLQRFLELAGLLRRRLGPILYQLPPSLHKDLERLDAFLACLPRQEHAVVEFRHASWYAPDTFDLLKRRHVALCIHDLGASAAPRIVTGRIVYVRFHGPEGRYAGNYPDPVLQDWAGWMTSQIGQVRALYAYFNNDVAGHAVANAQTLKQILGVS